MYVYAAVKMTPNQNATYSIQATNIYMHSEPPAHSGVIIEVGTPNVSCILYMMYPSVTKLIPVRKISYSLSRYRGALTTSEIK